MMTTARKYKKFPRFALSFAVVTSTLFSAGAASASGFLVARFGGEKGHPTTDSPTAIYYNPAGLALGHGTRVFVEGTGAFRLVTYDRPVGAIDNVLDPGEMAEGTPSDAVTANAGEAKLSNIVASPFVGIVSDLGVPDLGVGLALYVPFGGSAKWDGNSAFDGNATYPGAEDGISRWWAIEGEIRAMYVTAAGAYRWPCIGLSVGVGLNLVLESVNTVRARLSSGQDNLVYADGSVREGRSLIDATGTTFAVGGGAIWEAKPGLFLGVSYQSQPGFGTTEMSGTMTNRLPPAAVTENDFVFEHSLPDIIRAGVRWRAQPKIEARLFGEYARWSSYEQQCLRAPDGVCAFNADGSLDTAAGGANVIANFPRDWHDAFGVRAGASYWQSDALELFGGLGYDSNAVPDETLDPAFIDMNKFSVAAGARYQLGKYAIQATYTQFIYMSRSVEPRARDAMGDAIAPAFPSRGPDSAGDYSQSIGALNLGVEASF
jgi:long-chain fatty acid transport protein